MSHPAYGLYSHQVPPPPCDGDGYNYGDMLRWIIAVADSDYKMLGFVAGVLSYLQTHDGITDKQAKAVNEIARRMHDLYDAGILECQLNTRDTSDDCEHGDLYYAAPEGNA